MTCAASRHVAIWIDHVQTILLVLGADSFDRSGPLEPEGGRSQYYLDAQRYRLIQQYYDAVLSHLEPQDEILILGPGQAKSELCRQIEQSEGLKGKVVGLHHASGLTEVELVFPTGDAWRPEKVSPAMGLKGKLKASFRHT